MADVTPVHEMSRACAERLELAREEGEPVTEAVLREELGVGHDDLRRILGQLAERGMASEVTPGEWIQPGAVAGDDGPLRVTLPDAELPEAAPESEPRALTRVVDDGPLAGLALPFAEPTVRLTRGIANALDAEALGKLLLAGLNDTGDDDVFVLEIVP